jgi:hypothetical protein
MFAFTKSLGKSLTGATDITINNSAASGGVHPALWLGVAMALQDAQRQGSKAKPETLVACDGDGIKTPSHKKVRALCDAFFNSPKLGYSKPKGLKIADTLIAVTGMINGHVESTGKPAPFPVYGCPLAFYDSVSVEPATAAEVDAAIAKETAKDRAKIVKQAKSALAKAIAALELLNESQTKQLFAACANKLSVDIVDVIGVRTEDQAALL